MMTDLHNTTNNSSNNNMGITNMKITIILQWIRILSMNSKMKCSKWTTMIMAKRGNKITMMKSMELKP